MTGPIRALAVEAEKRRRAQVEHSDWESQWGPMKPARTGWADALSRYGATKRDRATQAKMLQRLQWWARWAEAHGAPYVETFSPEGISHGAQELGRLRVRGKPLTRQTQRHYLVTLRTFYQTLKVWRVVRENPAREVPLPTVRPSRRPILTPLQRTTLLQAAEPHVRDLILTAITTGMREGAIMALTGEDFTARPGWVRAMDEKTDAPYWIPVAPPLRDLVRRLGVTKGPLWRRQGVAYRRFPTKAWYRALEGAKLFRVEPHPSRPKATVKVWTIRFHDLRHLVGVTLAEAGVPTDVMRAFLHHASRQASEIYTRWVSDQALEEASGKLWEGLTGTRRQKGHRRGVRS